MIDHTTNEKSSQKSQTPWQSKVTRSKLSRMCTFLLQTQKSYQKSPWILSVEKRIEMFIVKYVVFSVNG